MKIALEDWFEDIHDRRQLTIRAPVSAVGKHDKHLGPMWAYAEVGLVAEPADAWDVEILLPEEDRLKMEKEQWLREALLGVLDVLVSRPPDPVLRLRLK